MTSTDVRPRAYLHIGAPKTGTTYLQGVLWANRDALAADGVAVPGLGPFEHVRAARDAGGSGLGSDEPGADTTGAWDLLARRASRRREASVVISAEHLAALRPARVQHVVASLAPREVHVVYATRDLGRLMPSEWQEHVKNGSSLDLAVWSEQVLRSRGPGPGRWFWRVHEPGGVIRRWSSAVPVERIHVLTVPPPTADPSELWRRFASVLGVDATVADRLDAPTNRSLGYAETEVLRHVNSLLTASFSSWNYRTLAQGVLASDVLSASIASAPPVLPAQLGPLLVARQKRIIADIEASGCDVVGSVSDLQGAPVTEPSVAPTEADLFEAATRGVAGLLVEMGRRQDLARSRPSVRLLEALASQEAVTRTLSAMGDRSSRVDRALGGLVRRAGRRIRGAGL